MTKPYELFLRIPPHQGDTLIEWFADKADRYRHSTRWMGGFWEATWTFHVNEELGISRGYLRDWFDKRLMHRHEERSGGGVSWEGVIWEMVLTLDGFREKRTVADVFNVIKCLYTDASDNSQETNWYTNQASIDRYGRRELLLVKDKVNSAEAIAACQKELAIRAEAHPENTGINDRWADSLDITAVGDIFTANNRYVTAATGSSFDGRISNVVSTDCDFLTAGRIRSNSLVPEDLTIETRAWDAMLELAEFGDGTNPWRLWCDVGGRIWYEQASNTPAYEWHGRVKGLTDVMGCRQPWLVQPGVVRNMTRHSSKPIPGTFLQDGRDSWILEVEMGDGMTNPSLKPAQLEPEEIENKATMIQGWLEKETA
jgi:hypothetical protein